MIRLQIRLENPQVLAMRYRKSRVRPVSEAGSGLWSDPCRAMMREKRLSQFPDDYFDTIIIDEAHHCISDSYQRVLQHFPEAKVLRSNCNTGSRRYAESWN